MGALTPTAVAAPRGRGRAMAWRWDAAIAAALALAAVAVTLSPEGNDGTRWDTVLAPAVALPVLWWRRAPLGAAAGLLAGVALSALPTLSQTRCGPAIVAAVLIASAAGARRPLGPAALGLALVLAAMGVLWATDPLLDGGGWLVALLPAPAWLVGRAAGAQAALAGELRRRTNRLEARRARAAKLAGQVERARLARAMESATRRRVGQLVALADRASADPAPPALEAVERAARAALDELRRLLGVLRDPEATAAAAPPTLADPCGWPARRAW